MTVQNELAIECPCERGVLNHFSGYYETNYGAAVLGDSAEQLAKLPTGSVNAVVTSPPMHSILRRSMGMLKKTHISTG